MMSPEQKRKFYEALLKKNPIVPTLVNNSILKSTWLDTKLGPMVAIADDEGLYVLEFIDGRGLEREVERLRIKLKTAIIPGENGIIKKIKRELTHYFEGKKVVFETPLHLIGTSFQTSVWKALLNIPPGETRSYLDVAKAINKPTACRAVAGANGANQLAIVIPCHRVINSNGELGGYGGGISRKRSLLNMENCSKSLVTS